MIAGDPVAAIRELKEQPGKGIVQYGFDNELTRFELVDVTQLESQIVVLSYESR